MLTVKHVLDGGFESIQPVAWTNYSPKLDTVFAGQHFNGPSTAEFTNGTVYVMNEAGATVGRYRLERTGDSKPQISAPAEAPAARADTAATQSAETVSTRRQTENGWAT